MRVGQNIEAIELQQQGWVTDPGQSRFHAIVFQKNGVILCQKECYRFRWNSVPSPLQECGKRFIDRIKVIVFEGSISKMMGFHGLSRKRKVLKTNTEYSNYQQYTRDFSKQTVNFIFYLIDCLMFEHQDRTNPGLNFWMDFIQSAITIALATGLVKWDSSLVVLKRSIICR